MTKLKVRQIFVTRSVNVKKYFFAVKTSYVNDQGLANVCRVVSTSKKKIGCVSLFFVPSCHNYIHIIVNVIILAFV